MNWRHAARSVQGASHLRAGQQNQDSFTVTSGPDTVIAVVSDGHGGAKYVRSRRGSDIAVRVMSALLVQVASSRSADCPDHWSFIKRQAQEKLAHQLVDAWHTEVLADLAATPLTDDELAAVAEAEGDRARELVRETPVLAYGATCLAVLAARDYPLFVQLGDGDILVVNSSGEVTRPMPADDRLFANETTSLCAPHAQQDVRVVFSPLAAPAAAGPSDERPVDRPALVLLASDGLANSYRSADDFIKVGADLLQMCRHEGMEQVQSGLVDWLTGASSSGSGDDITVAILKRDEDEDRDVILDERQALTETVQAMSQENAQLQAAAAELRAMLDAARRRVYWYGWTVAAFALLLFCAVLLLCT